MGGLRLQENLHAAGRWRFEWFLPGLGGVWDAGECRFLV